MSTPQRIKIPRLPDRSIIECFRKLGEKYGVTSINVSALAFSHIGNVDLLAESNQDFQALIEHNSTLVETCSLKISGLTVTYYRGGQYQPEEKSPIFDEIVLSFNAQKGDVSNLDKLDIVALITSELKAFNPGRSIESGVSKEQNDLWSIHESTLSRLEKLNEDLIRQSSDFRASIEVKFDNKSAELEEGIKAKELKLEEENAKRIEEFRFKEKVLKEKIEAIDDRDNTHARREIRNKMLSDVKNRIEKFGVSDATEDKRKPVFIGIVIMIAAISLMLGYTIFEIYMLNFSSATGENVVSQNQYWLWVKVSLLSFGLLATILFYIKWQNQWAEQHANSEFQLQQFYLDVNRANWVIESCLEWRKETDSAIPTVLLESVTRNLFHSGSDESENLLHPSDELASALLGSASNLKLKVGENELEFDKPGKIGNKKSGK